MKIKYIFVLIAVFIMAFAVNISAETEEYVVKFKEGYIPPSEDYDLTAVNVKHNIYKTQNVNFTESVQKNIEYCEKNKKAILIGEQEQKAPLLRLASAKTDSWQLNMIRASAIWEVNTFGNNVRVAVIDSGCSSHVDLKGNLLAGKNYFNASSDVSDDIGHGTHVCGVIAAKTGEAMSGAATKAKIVPLKCFRLDENDEAESVGLDEIANAVLEAVDTYNCKVINMSFGIPEDDSLVRYAVSYAYQNGVIMLAAVGNSASQTLYYPAAYDEVIGVGSVNRNKTKSSFSQYNSSVFVVAPGENVLSLKGESEYCEKRGTSQATPYVSAAAALALSLKEDLKPPEFKQILIDSSEDLGTYGYDTQYGYGLLDCENIKNCLFEDILCYISPINVTESEANVYIKNNTEEILNGVLIFGIYDSLGRIKEIKTESMLIPAHDARELSQPVGSGEEIRCFLWESLQQMLPVSVKRIS